MPNAGKWFFPASGEILKLELLMILTHLGTATNGSSFDKLAGKPMPAVWFADDPDADATSPQAVYEAALRYVEAGLSVIPITTDCPDKTPDFNRVVAWKIYQLRLPRKDEIQHWNELGGSFGLAILGGS